MTRTELDNAIATIIARFGLLMQGSTQAWNSAGGRDSEHPGGKCPPGSGVHPGERWRDRYNRCVTDSQRRDVVHAAQHALDSARGYSDAPKVPRKVEAETDRVKRQRKEILAHLENGWTIADVALGVRVSEAFVRRVLRERDEARAKEAGDRFSRATWYRRQKAAA